MNKLYKIALVLVLMFGIVGCDTSKKDNPVTAVNTETTNEEFKSFVDGLPKKIAGTNGLDLNYTFHDPSAFGIEKEVGDIYPVTMDEYKESLKECKDLLKELEKFDYQSLSKIQQLEYDVLKDYLDRQLLMEDYVNFDNHYLGSYLGFQAQLPLILLEFELHDKKDLETYLNVLKTAPEAYKQFVENEKVRQEKGTGMSQIIVDGVIEQCENFAAGDVSFLVDEMNEKIDAADFLTEEEKGQAKVDNENYTRNEFIQAYNDLKAELQNLEVKDIDGGIAQQKNGPKYYEALFQKTSGFDWSIPELEEYLDDKEDEYMGLLTKEIYKNPSLQNTLLQETYGEFSSIEENIDYLAKRYKEYFPDAGTMNYRVVEVPESMKENFSPAAYLTSRVDRKSDEPSLILINGAYDSKNFSTIAHEGYPGHMYQDCYFQQLDVTTFRYLVGCGGYAEGWATYIEGKTPWFTKNDNEEALTTYIYNQRVSHAIMAKWDIDINYHGISREEFKKEFEKSYGTGKFTDDEINDQYTQLMENPTNYLKYFVNGLYFEDLYLKAEKELGKNFDPVEFHKVILDTGEVGMPLLTKQVDAYIKENK